MRVSSWIIGFVIRSLGVSALILLPCLSRGGLDSAVAASQVPALAGAPLASDGNLAGNPGILNSDGGATSVAAPPGPGFTTVAAASETTTRTSVTQIDLAGSSITVTGSGAIAQGCRVLIRAGGTYSIRGTLDDGQIVVDSADKNPVVLILNGVRITCSTSSPIYVVQAKDVVITLAAGTENVLTDGSSYVFDTPGADEPNAALFSKDDLAITGTGSLIVNANYNNGIQSKDDLTIVGGTITVHAANHGIKGKDSVVITGGTITVIAGNDGIQASNEEDPSKGFVRIEGGTISIKADDDGIQAETSVLISNGYITIVSGGGSTNAPERQTTGRMPMPGMRIWDQPAVSTASSGRAKGIKANVDITIDGGTITIDAADDAIHSNDSITINGGRLTLASGDDAVHADSTIEINGGDIDITACYEGIESAVITINNGHIRIVASDDAINAASGTGGVPMMRQMGPQAMGGAADNWLYINGGYIVIDAMGDGFDVNGSIVMTGGIVLIHGPTVTMESAIDYDRTFTMTGGYLVAAGSAGMAQAPSASSTVNSVMMTFPSVQPAGSLVHIAAADSGSVVTFAPAKAYQSVVVASPLLKNGSTYTIYSGGRSTGAVVDGLYSGGTYTPGAQVAQFRVAGSVTYVGAAAGRFR